MGTDLQITDNDHPEEHIRLRATSGPGIIREGESVINDRFYGQDPFPGFHWQSLDDGWITTDHDLKE